jgi:hypothetical protein
MLLSPEAENQHSFPKGATMRTLAFSRFSASSPFPDSRGFAAAVLVSAVLFLAFDSRDLQAQIETEMWRLTLDGETIEGSVAASSNRIVFLFDRQGRMFRFSPDEVTEAQMIGNYFQPLPEPRIRRELGRRLGRDYQVSPTSHYLVAHPENRGSHWPERFENVYRSVLGYFTVRGFACSDPPWPLQAIVSGNRHDFARVAAEEGIENSRGLAGLYLLTSNRVILFDQTGGASFSGDRQTMQTIVHEAIHQVSFNIGVHDRCVDNPTWIVEGIATMLEIIPSDRQWKLGNHSMRNPNQLPVFLSIPEGYRGKLMRHLVLSDQLFREHPRVAYALSWGLTTYLAEKQTSKFSDYLQVIRNHSPIEPVAARTRQEDFVRFFGDDWEMLAARVSRYVGDL